MNSIRKRNKTLVPSTFARVAFRGNRKNKRINYTINLLMQEELKHNASYKLYSLEKKKREEKLIYLLDLIIMIMEKTYYLN